ncbi:MAG: translation initiation factor IF-3 [Deltaproteobacteria bacterium]|nr:translation initiation factor IF-3 [Deltaproteobacteria bacterium]
MRVNHQIRAAKIRVVLEDGAQLGVLSPYEALKEAEKRGLDLVEISPKASPPVCKLMDFGKFKYELKKKAQGSKKANAGNVVKEVTLSPQTDVHDLNFKMKNSQRFLEEGHRVKVMVKFRGREMAHPEIGRKQMERIMESLKEFGVPESDPKMEGRMLMAVFVPMAQASKIAAKTKTPEPVKAKPADPLKSKLIVPRKQG